MRERVTQGDIARQAGVHRTTVSLALRNHPSIPLLTRQRIRDLAEALRYRPDPSLSALMAYRNAGRTRKLTGTLAYLTHWPTRWGWRNASAQGAFHTGAIARAGELGFSLEHVWLGDYEDAFPRLADILATRGIRGVIVASHDGCGRDLNEFPWDRFSVVKIDLRPHALAVDTVSNDQRAIVQTALRRILQKGYRRIGLVLHRGWDDVSDRAWSAGFFAIQTDLPAGDRIPLLTYQSPHDADSYAEMRVPLELLAKWLRAHRPEVVVGFGGYVLPQLEALKLRVPGEVAFVDMLLEDETGGIAGVRQNCRRVGEVAAELIAQRVAYNVTGIPAIPLVSLVEGTWCEGASLPVRRRRCRMQRNHGV